MKKNSLEKEYNTVTLSVNIFERTYKNILKKKFFSDIEESVNFRFDEIHVIVNNVSDRNFIKKKLDKLKYIKTITEYYFVDDYIDRALESLGLSIKVLGPSPYCYYSNHLYVAIYLTNTKFLFHYDPDIKITKKGNFIKDSIIMLNNMNNILGAAPMSWKFIPEKESLAEDNKFYYYYTFGDPIFFIEQAKFRQDIYQYKSLAAFARHPCSHIWPIFEERVDAYCRVKNFMFAYYKNSIYSQENEGENPIPETLVFMIKRYYKLLILRILIVLRLNNPKYRIYK